MQFSKALGVGLVVILLVSMKPFQFELTEVLGAYLNLLIIKCQRWYKILPLSPNHSYWTLQMFSVRVINYSLHFLFSVLKLVRLFSATKARGLHIWVECKYFWSSTVGCVCEGTQRNLKRCRPFSFYFRYQECARKKQQKLTNYQGKALQENMWGLKKRNFKRLHIKYIFWLKSLSSHSKASAYRCKHTQSSDQPLKGFPDVLKKNA